MDLQRLEGYLAAISGYGVDEGLHGGWMAYAYADTGVVGWLKGAADVNFLVS